ncbi:hypothetical protein Acsp04_34650 [Actinomadura sp. NBRC 104425]|nr:hypothetical protein Acsp04_34650 [Actinomadura sp. NBRC 104425]
MRVLPALPDGTEGACVPFPPESRVSLSDTPAASTVPGMSEHRRSRSPLHEAEEGTWPSLPVRRSGRGRPAGFLWILFHTVPDASPWLQSRRTGRAPMRQLRASRRCVEHAQSPISFGLRDFIGFVWDNLF